MSKAEQGIRVTQKCYEQMKWSGIVLDSIVTFFVAFYRFKLYAALAQQPSPANLDRISDHASYFSIFSISLAIISGFFLIDAMRRLQKSFKQNHSFTENRCKMIAHVFALFISQVCLICIIIVEQQIADSHVSRDKEVSYLRITFNLILPLSQAVFIYLLVQFTKPVSFAESTL